MDQTVGTNLPNTTIPGKNLVAPIFREFLKSLRVHLLPILALGLYSVILFAYIKVFNLEHMSYFAVHGATGFHLFILTILAFVIFYCIRLQLRDKPKQLIPHVIAHLKQDFFTWDRFFSATIAISLFILLLVTFSNFKRMIPEVIPFQFDLLFADIDRAMHFGVDPWRILQPVLGFPLVTFFINFLYNVWLFLVIMVFYWQAFATGNRQLRDQYILSFFLCWMVIGTLFATLLSSAGPCFYPRFVSGEDIYAPLMSYLNGANEVYPIWALDTQNILLQNYESKSAALASGISAMPSMHVSISWLMVLLGWKINKYLGWAFTIYCGFILIGSVHLAWHYAVDGYVSIILTTGIWLICGRITNNNRSAA